MFMFIFLLNVRVTKYIFAAKKDKLILQHDLILCRQ